MSGIKFIIGLDIGLRNLACSIHDNLGKHIETFNLTTKSGMNDHDSVDDLVEELFDRINKYLVNPDAVIVYIEDIVFGSQGKGTARAEVNGVVKWNLRQEGIRIYGATNSALNSFLFGKYSVKPAKPGGGRAKSKDIKQCTMDTLHRYCNYYTRNDNMADAYCAALFGYAHSIEKRRLTVRALSRIVK